MTTYLNGHEACAILAQSINESVYAYTSTSQLTQINIWNQPVKLTRHDQDPLSHIVNPSHLTTAIMSSESLLAAIPYLYKLANDRTSLVIHVSAGHRTRSTFADFTQVMSVRQSGLALLSASSVQEAHDLALIAQLASLLTSTPFLHFFDSKRISHEYSSINVLDTNTLLKFLPIDFVQKHFNIFIPSQQSTYLKYKANKSKLEEEENSESLDVYDAVKNVMDQFAIVTGRSYAPLEYTGHSEAEFVIAAIGAGATVVEQTLNAMLKTQPESKLGALKIRLYRPWSEKHFLKSLPSSVRHIAVLEPIDDYTSTWSPMFLDIAAAYQIANDDLVDIYSGQYGVVDEDFSPSMVRAVYDGLMDGNLERTFQISSLPMKNETFDVFSFFPIEQIIFIGSPSLAMIYSQSSKNNVQLYTIGEATHVRTTPEKGSLLPSLIQVADAIVLDSFPFTYECEQAAIKSLKSLKYGGYVIVDNMIGFDSISADIKNEAHSRCALLVSVKDIHVSFKGSISNILSSSETFVEKVPKDWKFEQLNSLNSIPTPIQKKVTTALPIETSYIKMLEQVFGESLFIANAYKSSSIWSPNNSQCGSANPEFGYGRLLNYIQERTRLVNNVIEIIRTSSLPTDAIRVLSQWLVLVNSPHSSHEKINEAADLVVQILSFYPLLVEKKDLLYSTSNWLIGSDTWAYDLGQSGLHHVITSGENINILVIDTSPYTNQVEREQRKKDIGLYAMNFCSVYVASVALYSSYTGVLHALMEADAYKGPSVVIAYLPQFSKVPNPLETLKETKVCVDNGSWPLYRWNPDLEHSGQDMFTLDSQRIKRDLEAFLARENHLSQLVSSQLDISNVLVSSLETDIKKRHLQIKIKARADYARLLSGFGSSNGSPLTILFGSDNGNGEGVAKRIATRAKTQGLQVKLTALDDYGDILDLANETNLVIVCSTAGQGEFPSNAREFWKSLNGLIKGDINLSEVNIGVFGLGDSHYWPREEDVVFYNRPSKLLDAKFEVLGASRLIQLGLGDDQDTDGYETVFSVWLSELWKALGIKNVGEEEAPVYTDDQMKFDSNFLRGDIAQDLVDDSTGTVSETSQKLMKFHGAYVQDDRDLREERKKQGLEKAYSFLIRVRTPGGVATPKQWLAIDTISTKFGNKTMKLTTRQSFQLHGVLRKKLRTAIRNINKSLLTTLGACGDVNRNIMCTSVTDIPEIRDQIQATAIKLVDLLAPKTTAYHEIWLDNSMVAGKAVQDFEPIYGPSYLPHKFKISIAVPPNNDVDVYAHDLSYVAIVDNNLKQVVGYNVFIGGGMGHAHGNKKTYPRPASLIGYIPINAIEDITRAVVLTQRDHGDRVDRKRGRFKYTVDNLGLEFIINEIEERSGIKFEKAKEFHFNDNVDFYGWTKGQGDTWNFCIFIENGRVKDTPDFLCQTGLRELARFHKGEFRLTANQNLVICNIPESDLEKTKALLAKYKLDNLSLSGVRKTSMACVALPTCGLAMAEAERYLPSLITLLEEILEEAGLREDSIVIRMTGCPNGCSRPYLAELAFVGKALDTYNMYLGGSPKGDRLNKLYKESLQEEEILNELRPMIRKYALERNNDEPFGDWVIRAGYVKKTITGKDFNDP